MDHIWIALGCAVLIITFIDTFLAVMNYDEDGLFVNRIARGQWIVLRSFTRRITRRWRPVALRQVTGILIVSVIFSWIAGLVLGFALIYLGLIGLGHFQLSSGVANDFQGALYLSIGQFSTVGADNISPAGGWINVIPVLEALSSVVLLSFIIAFLSNVFGVIQLLRSLCADFFRTGPGVGSPTEALGPYFANGEPRDLDRHLGELVDDFNLYCDSLRQHHAAYHFQSGDDQFSLPFALYMTSGVLGALRWGLPTRHAATGSPSIVHLAEAFDGFRERRYRKMKWQTAPVPAPLAQDEFTQQLTLFRTAGSRGGLDPMSVRFFVMNDEMAALIQQPSLADLDDAYQRYVQWLPFAHRSQQFVGDVSRDLDFQPIYRGSATAPDAPAATPAPATPTPAEVTPRRRRARGLIGWMRRQHLFVDPGNVRLSAALRTLAAVVVAVVIAIPVTSLVGLPIATAGVFSGLIAFFSAASSSGWGTGVMRVAGIISIVPVAIGITAGTMVPRDPLWSVVGLAVVAFTAVIFVSYYFALLIALSEGELVGALIAAAIGVTCSWVANLLPQPSVRRRVRAGIEALTERVGIVLDAGVDLLDTADNDHHLLRNIRAEQTAVRRTVASLTGLLDPDDPPKGMSAAHARTLRLRSFDVELAAENLLRALPGPSDYIVSVAERAVLAGELVNVQAALRSAHGAAGASQGTPTIVSADLEAPAPESWPARARHAHAAIRELAEAVRSLHTTDSAADIADDADVDQTSGAENQADARKAASRARARAVDRRAVQSGVSTGLAMFLGSFVSTTHQYWAAMPAFQSLSGTNGETRLKGFQRIIGTVIGAGSAFGLALLTGHNPIIAFPVLALAVFFMAFLRPVASAWTAFWQTVMLATMYDLLGKLDAEAIDVRIIETIIGAVVAVIISAILLPTRTRTRVLSGMSGVVSQAMSLTQDALRRLTDPRAAEASSAQLADAEVTVNRQFHEIQESARPLRHNAGSQQRGGIEGQLTSLSALLYYVRHIVRDTASVSSPTVRADQWQRLAASTDDNFRSTLSVLGGSLPAHLHDPGEFSTTAGVSAAESERLALLDVERINQSLVAFMAAVKPGSTETENSPNSAN